MSKNYFKIIRAGINTTFQDLGRENLYHIGIPFSGAMDNRNYLISNKLVGNSSSAPVIEFAYQGPLLRYFGDKINIAITGEVNFTIKKKGNLIKGNCYQSIVLDNGDELDILSTKNSVYGYLALGGEIDLKYQWSSCSINTKANIGANEGKKLGTNQKINFLILQVGHVEYLEMLPASLENIELFHRIESLQFLPKTLLMFSTKSGSNHRR